MPLRALEMALQLLNLRLPLLDQVFEDSEVLVDFVQVVQLDLEGVGFHVLDAGLLAVADLFCSQVSTEERKWELFLRAGRLDV